MTLVGSKRLSIKQAFLLSFVLHGGLAFLLFAVLFNTAAYDDETLVIDLNGVESNEQIDEKLKESVGGEPGVQATRAQQQKASATSDERADDATPTEQAPVAGDVPAQNSNAPVRAAPGATQAMDVMGLEQRQDAHKIRSRPEASVDPLQYYAKLLSKRVQKKLVYPEAGRWAGWQGAPVVAFAITTDGSIRDGSLKIVSSSGEPKLDASALRTILGCAPFEPPPHEVALRITVKYGR